MPVRFASSDDVKIAHDTVGDGAIDIVYVQGYVSHLDVMWELPAYRSFCERIGEIERSGNEVAGIAVHEGARVADAAGPNQIWVSDIVRQLTAGSGIDYQDEGPLRLKGIPGERQLYSVK
jgi:hypothetical protein